jgi:hypothetical protein
MAEARVERRLAAILAADVVGCMTERNAGIPDDRIEFRIGINVGDVAVEDGDIFGDGVNVAARLEGLARRTTTLQCKIQLGWNR